MTLKVSTGLRNKMLVENSFKAIMEENDGCKLRIYSGEPPTNADAAVDPANELLVEITGDGAGDGLVFDTEASGGVVGKDDSQQWQGTVLASGEAAWFRLVADGDTATSSTSEPRIQGEIAQAGAELNLSSVDLVEDAEQVINYFVVNLPTA